MLFYKTGDKQAFGAGSVVRAVYLREAYLFKRPSVLSNEYTVSRCFKVWE